MLPCVDAPPSTPANSIGERRKVTTLRALSSRYSRHNRRENHSMRHSRRMFPRLLHFSLTIGGLEWSKKGRTSFSPVAGPSMTLPKSRITVGAVFFTVVQLLQSNDSYCQVPPSDAGTSCSCGVPSQFNSSPMFVESAHTAGYVPQTVQYSAFFSQSWRTGVSTTI
jgi:hypothetical protein